MKRNVKNDKVLRAMAIGLATMIAVTSTPVTVLADTVDGKSTQKNEATENTKNDGKEGEGESEGESQEKSVNEKLADVQHNIETTATEAEKIFNIEGENGPATGTVGEATQNVLNIQSAQNTFESSKEALSNQCDTSDQRLYEPPKDKNGNYKEIKDSNDPNYNSVYNKPGNKGRGQVKKAMDTANDAAENFGVEFGDVTFDEDGNVDKINKDTTKFDEMVGKAAGQNVEAAKKDVYDSLNNVIGSKEQDGSTAQLIEAANNAVEKANKDTRAVFGDTDPNSTYTSEEAQEKVDQIQTSTDGDTRAKLEKIENDLYQAVSQNNLGDAVEALVGASKDAAAVASSSLTKTQNALKDAQAAADDAVNHSNEYTRQQMVDVAQKAGQAAKDARDAVDLANQTVEAANNKVEESEKAVKAAKDLLDAAESDAIKVLEDYRNQINGFNSLIDTANISRADAISKMKSANDAIDAALEIMKQDSDSEQSINAKISAISTAMKEAQGALKDFFKCVDEKDKKNPWYTATKQYLKNKPDPDTYVNTERENYDTAKKQYDDDLEAAQEATKNKAAAEAAVNEINEKIGDITKTLEGFSESADSDMDDIKALLATGMTIAQLNEVINRTDGEVKRAGEELIGAYGTNKKDLGDKDLDLDGVLDLYNTALEANKTDGDLDKNIKTYTDIYEDCMSNKSEKEQASIDANDEFRPEEEKLNKVYKIHYTYDEESKKYECVIDGYADEYDDLVKASNVYQNGDEEYTPTDKIEKDYMDEDGKNVYKMSSGHNYDVDDKKYYKPGWIPTDKDIKKTRVNVTIVNDNELEETVAHEYELPTPVGGYFDIIADEDLNVIKGENMLSQITKEEYERLSNSDESEMNKAALTAACKEILPTDEFESFEMTVDETSSKNILTVKVKDPAEGHYNTYLTYTFSYEINKVDPDNSWASCNYYLLNYSFKSFNVDSLVVSGVYNETTTYYYTKYELTEGAEEARQALSDAESIKKDLTSFNLLKNKKETAASEYGELMKNLSLSSNKLFGEGGSKDSPIKGSLLAQWNSNQKVIKAIGTEAEEYKTVSNYLDKANQNLTDAKSFDPEKADLTEEQRAIYNNSKAAQARVANAQKLASEYLSKANEALETMKDSIKEEKEFQDKYNATDARITRARQNLDIVYKKLSTLKDLHAAAKSKYGLEQGNTFDADSYTVDGKEISLDELNKQIIAEVESLEKFVNINDFDSFGYLSFNGEFGVFDKGADFEKATVKISENLKKAIKYADDILKEAGEELNVAKKNREDAEKDAKAAEELANKAQAEADRAAKALADWKEPVKPDDNNGNGNGNGNGNSNSVVDNGTGTTITYSSSSSDDDDDDDDSSSSSSADTGSGSGTVVGTVASLGTGLVPVPVAGSGTDSITLTPVAGTGTGAAGGRGAGVLGARNPEGNSDASGNNAAGNAESKDVKNAGKDKTVVADANGNGGNGADGTNGTNGTNGSNGTKVADPTTPLNATPFSEEGTGFNWLWFVGSAAAAGAGFFGYNSRKKAAADRDEVKKYKKN